MTVRYLIRITLVLTLINSHLAKQINGQAILDSKITAIDGSRGDLFGYSVAISNNIALIGVPGSNKAMIFEYDKNSWSEVTTLSSTNNGFFGGSVSLTQNHAIVGAPLDNEFGSLTGAAYVFNREGLNWVQHAKLTASDREEDEVQSEELFGEVVAISGDYIVIGAPREDAVGIFSGSAYIFKREGSNWVEDAKLTASDGNATDFFGSSVAIEGELILIGAPGNDAAYIFKREESGWVEQMKLVSSANEEDNFGVSVSISGENALVGAYFYKRLTGSAYVFKQEGITWREEVMLTEQNGEEFNQFGSATLISDTQAFIGVTSPDGLFNARPGAVVHYLKSGSTWIEKGEITPDSRSNGDSFGFALAFEKTKLLVGSPHHIENEREGAVFVYLIPDDTSITHVPELMPTGNIVNILTAYPNPFIDEVTIAYSSVNNTYSQVVIFNLMGQIVKSFPRHYSQAGLTKIEWDGRNNRGGQAPSGVYVVSLKLDSRVEMKKIIKL